MKKQYFDSLEKWFMGQDREPVCICMICGEEANCSNYLKDYDYCRTVTCETCGFMWEWWQPTQEVLDDFYTDSGPVKKWAKIKSTAEEDHRQSKKFDYFNVLASKGAAVLDVGCGNGHFLNGLDSSIIKIGIEQSKESAAHCKFAVYSDYDKLKESLHGKRKYSLITFFGVLEHLKDPIAELKKYEELLEEGGVIGIIVPNLDSLVVRTLGKECCTFCPQHLWYYDINTLTKLMGKLNYHLLSYGTREAELQPVLRDLKGLAPYDYMFNLTDKDITEEKILDHGLGYKITALYQKGGMNECNL